MAQLTIYVKQNDTRPIFHAFIRDELDRIVDVTGALVSFNMRNLADNTVIISAGLIEVVDASNGEIQYQWAPADTSTAAVCQAEVQVVFVGGAIETFPNDGYIKVIILDDIA
jgi:hypothetical protein